MGFVANTLSSSAKTLKIVYELLFHKLMKSLKVGTFLRHNVESYRVSSYIHRGNNIFLPKMEEKHKLVICGYSSLRLSSFSI